jgi:hypothetical protein
MPSTHSQPGLSIVVLTRNNRTELDATLASIRAQVTTAVLQVIVVDGSDTPVPPEVVTPFELVRDYPARGWCSASRSLPIRPASACMTTHCWHCSMRTPM